MLTPMNFDIGYLEEVIRRLLTPNGLVIVLIVTSVRLIDYTESPADSETMRPDNEIPIVSSKTPTYPPSIPKKYRIYTYPTIKISTDFDSHTIVEYQIFCFIFPIVEANLG